jgi:hypothetical protein
MYAAQAAFQEVFQEAIEVTTQMASASSEAVLAAEQMVQVMSCSSVVVAIR